MLPAYAAIFERCEYRVYDVPDALNDLLRLYQVYFRDVFYCGLPEPEAAVSGVSAHGLLLERLFQGMRMKDAVREVSALPGYSRNDVYKASLEVAAFLDGEEE